MLFQLVAKGCPKGSRDAVRILKLLIDASYHQRCDATCLDPCMPTYPDRLSRALGWVPTDDVFLQVEPFAASALERL
jgi:hypothetical protein